jgi:branched-chain amino acid transport system ATP-binding protein
MLFPHLTVDENLRCGAASRRDTSGINDTLSEVFDLFPQLPPLQHQQAGLLSGGEQQMVAVGRALMAKPSLLICDELSLGLAPLIVRDLFLLLDRINQEGVAVLAIEQNARIALRHSKYAYALEVGEVVLEGPSEELRENQEVQDLYMGGGGDIREAYAAIRREVNR